uniref:Uncharacterized protein n=1 Tax=Romanomermis culicivorax TaxID=13658 RepID=A0A915I887_ROMCU
MGTAHLGIVNMSIPHPSFETNNNGKEYRQKPGQAPPAPIDLPYRKHSVDVERVADSVQPDTYKSKCPPPRLPDLCNDIADSTAAGNNGLFSPTRQRFMQSPNSEPQKKAGAVHSLPEKIKGDAVNSVRSPTIANVAAADTEGPSGTFADALRFCISYSLLLF